MSSAGRAIGLDVHVEFCELAVCENGEVRSAGRVDSTPEALEVLAASLLPTDRVALEVMGASWVIIRCGAVDALIARSAGSGSEPRLARSSQGDAGRGSAESGRTRSADRPPFRRGSRSTGAVLTERDPGLMPAAEVVGFAATPRPPR